MCVGSFFDETTLDSFLASIPSAELQAALSAGRLSALRAATFEAAALQPSLLPAAAPRSAPSTTTTPQAVTRKLNGGVRLRSVDYKYDPAQASSADASPASPVNNRNRDLDWDKFIEPDALELGAAGGGGGGGEVKHAPSVAVSIATSPSHALKASMNGAGAVRVRSAAERDADAPAVWVRAIHSNDSSDAVGGGNELPFVEGDVIKLIDGPSDRKIWRGMVVGDPNRREVSGGIA
jgi:hypothetical protein